MRLSIITSVLLLVATYAVAEIDGSGSSDYQIEATGFNSSTTWHGDSAGENGIWNTFIGHVAGETTTGGWNTFIGAGAGRSNTSGTSNTFIGEYCGGANTTGGSNTFLGMHTGDNNTIGSGNILVGYYAGASAAVDMDNTLYIENSTSNTPLIYGEFDNDLVKINGRFEVDGNVTTTDIITSTWAGSNTVDDGLTNLLVLSANNSEADKESDAGFGLKNARADIQWNFRTHQDGTAFVATLAGTGGPEFTVKNATANVSGTELYLGNGAKNVGGVWINASSRALKENIKDLSTQDALAAFHKLQPVTYNYKSDKKEQVVGFIAEDVPALVAIQGRDGLSSMDMVAVLTKVVQEQDKMIKVQAEKIAKLETMQKRLVKVESLLTNLALDTSKTTKEKISLK